MNKNKIQNSIELMETLEWMALSRRTEVSLQAGDSARSIRNIDIRSSPAAISENGDGDEQPDVRTNLIKVLCVQ